jgi:hypothetical protein
VSLSYYVCMRACGLWCDVRTFESQGAKRHGRSGDRGGRKWRQVQEGELRAKVSQSLGAILKTELDVLALWHVLVKAHVSAWCEERRL